MMFETAFTKTVLGHEGAYSNHPTDRGGETFYGISRKYHPGWPGWPVLDSYSQDDKQNLRLSHSLELADLVTDFYFNTFWQPLGLSDINSAKLTGEVFDSAVNMGTSRAAKWLQLACNYMSDNKLTLDGNIGPKTVAAVNHCMTKYGDDELLKILNGLQLIHYLDLVDRDPSQKVFLRGWLKRVA